MEESETKSKFKNKRVMMVAGGNILTQDELNDMKRLGSVPDGIMFDSRMEAEYYRDILLPRVVNGEIEVTLQPKFVLLKEFDRDGVKYRPITYIADFLVRYYDDRQPEAIDVKGVQTEVFSLKRKMFCALYPNINLLVMKRVRKYGGWITVEEYTAQKKKERKESRRIPSRPRARGKKQWN